MDFTSQEFTRTTIITGLQTVMCSYILYERVLIKRI